MIDWYAFFIVWLYVMIEYIVPIFLLIIVLSLLITGGNFLYIKKIKKKEINKIDETQSNET